MGPSLKGKRSKWKMLRGERMTFEGLEAVSLEENSGWA